MNWNMAVHVLLIIAATTGACTIWVSVRRALPTIRRLREKLDAYDQAPGN